MEGVIEYAISYNQTDGILRDLLETFEQNHQTDWVFFWRCLAGLDLMPDILQDKLIEIANTVDAAVVGANPAVQEHIANYNTLLSEGNKVVVVAHSQGNLFANIAYLGIDPEYLDGFGIVSVGNPDSYVAGDGPHTTLNEDIIIRMVPFSLPANVNNFFGINWHDWSGHKFADSYMAPGRTAEAKILDDTIETINKLNAPPYTPVTIAIKLYGQLYNPNGSSKYKTGDPLYLLWDAECDEPLPVKKAAGGSWAYPLSREEYEGAFFSDFKAILGQSSYVGSVPSLLYSRPVKTNMRKGIPNYAIPDSADSLAWDQNWNYEPLIRHTVYYGNTEAERVKALSELEQYIYSHRGGTHSYSYDEDAGSAVNNAGITDTWIEHQTSTVSGYNNLETFWYFGECCYINGYLLSPGDVQNQTSGSQSLSFNAPVGGVPKDFYVGSRINTLPPPASIDSIILSARNNSGAEDFVIGAEIDYSGSMTYSSSFISDVLSKKTINTMSADTSASGNGIVTGLSGNPVNISHNYSEHASGLVSDGKSDTWFWYPSYSGTGNVVYVRTEVDVSSAYDLSDQLQSMIAIETMQRGEAETYLIPPKSPASTDRGFHISVGAPVYGNLSTTYSVLSISAIVPDAKTQNPWELPDNEQLQNVINGAIDIFLTRNPTGGENYWKVQSQIQKVVW